MKNSIKTELINFAIESILDQDLKINSEDLHNDIFNTGYYIIGYFQCSEWLKSHGIGEFESIELVKELHEQHFGEFEMPERVHSEWAVNQLVYFYGLELMDRIKEAHKLKEA